MFDFEKKVHFCSDGLELSVRDHANILLAMDEKNAIQPDAYSLGGSVEAFEIKVAELMGKEKAIFMPSGTLANQIAVRTLAGDKSRVLAHKQSHLVNDCGDCIPKLNRLNLIPLGGDGATFTLEDVMEYVDRTADGKVDTGVGVISIETPVRRRNGEMFDFEELKKISAFARDSNIALHLDGARIFLQSAYTGIDPAEYASYFDTVYFSLWKYFNTPVGAMLAGPADVIEGLFHVRRMFGGCLYQSWPFAAFCLYFFDGLLDRLKSAMAAARGLKKALAADARFQIEEIENGSHIFILKVKDDIDPGDLRQRLEAHNIILPKPEASFRGFYMRVNESLNHMPPEQVAGHFIEALTDNP